MELQELINLCTNGAFPIVCCCVLFWQNNKLTESLAQINLVLSNLVSKIEHMERDDK